MLKHNGERSPIRERASGAHGASTAEPRMAWTPRTVAIRRCVREDVALVAATAGQSASRSPGRHEDSRAAVAVRCLAGEAQDKAKGFC